ncbi:MAG: CdaR family protein [Defluviitaleaceae bacterium]|nr:CdaR family protein [Defluviitaleaceae bacterium]
MKILKIIFADLHWKLVAVVAASLIWFVGMNMSNPFQNQIIPVRLNLENLEIMTREGIMVLNEDALRDINVSVLVRGLRSDMNALNLAMSTPERLAQYITVGVDFRAIDSQAVGSAEQITTQRLKITPNLQNGYEHLSINPPYIDVQLDMVQTQIFNVKVVQAGDVPLGFELQHIRLGREDVMVSGPRSEIRTISLVQANVDVTGIHEDEVFPVPFVVLDNEGEDMTERVRLNISDTRVSVRVWQIRSMPIAINAVGSPTDGFVVADISSDTDSVEIVGSAEALDTAEQLSVDISLNNASGSIRRTLALADWLPQGVSLRRGEKEEILVTARIEPIETRTLSVPRENVRSRGVVGLYQVVSDVEHVRVSISGPQSMIAALDTQDILPEFDLRGLPIGVHTVPLSIELPQGFALVGGRPTLIVQIYEPVTAVVEGEEGDGEGVEGVEGEREVEGEGEPEVQEVLAQGGQGEEREQREEAEPIPSPIPSPSEIPSENPSEPPNENPSPTSTD